MRKFIKVFVAMVAVSMIAIGSTQFAKAVWPPESCLPVSEGTYNAAIAANEPAATYCFYNPDTSSYSSSLALYGSVDLNKISVAICLKNQKSQEIFREHFKNIFRGRRIDPRENLFIISANDLRELSEKMALFTKYSPSDPDEIYQNWCTENLFFCSNLRAGMNRHSRDIDLKFRVKIRILMRALGRGFELGKTLRVYKDSATSEIYWGSYDYWSDIDEVFDASSGEWINIQSGPNRRARRSSAASDAAAESSDTSRPSRRSRRSSAAPVAAAESGDAPRPNKRSRRSSAASDAAAESGDAPRPSRRARRSPAAPVAAANSSDTSRPNKRSRRSSAAPVAAANSSDMPGSSEESESVAPLTNPQTLCCESYMDYYDSFIPYLWRHEDDENKAFELFPHSPRRCDDFPELFPTFPYMDDLGLYPVFPETEDILRISRHY